MGVILSKVTFLALVLSEKFYDALFYPICWSWDFEAHLQNKNVDDHFSEYFGISFKLWKETCINKI